MRKTPALLLALLLGPAALLSAADGLLQIGQACAVGPGCFPGDSPGFPVEITAGGSYVLTSNLTVPDENTTAIQSTVQHVTLDLNGFTIGGPVSCSGSGCVPSGGTGDGIAGGFHWRVLNGIVEGMGRHGVALGNNTHVERLLVRSNGGDGISVGLLSRVTECTSWLNGGYGVDVGTSSLVTDNGVLVNLSGGIRTTLADAGVVITGNTVYRNIGIGVHAGEGSVISGNAIWDNEGHGIDAGGDSLVIGNTIARHSDTGVRLGSRSGFRENVFSVNTNGDVVKSSISDTILDMGNNACDGTAVCTIDDP